MDSAQTLPNFYGYIYETKNLINGRMYVGQRKGVFVPWYCGSGTAIIGAVNKYGKKNFSVKTIAWSESESQLNALEESILAFYWERFGKDLMYNITKGGHQPPPRTGWHHSPETRLRMSEANKGRVSPPDKWTPELRKKISDANKGSKRSLEVRLEMSRSRRSMNRKNSKDTKQKMSLAQKERYRSMSEERRQEIDEINRKKLKKIAEMPNWHIGKKRSDETRKKISLSKLGKIPWNKGLKMKEISRE